MTIEIASETQQKTSKIKDLRQYVTSFNRHVSENLSLIPPTKETNPINAIIKKIMVKIL